MRFPCGRPRLMLLAALLVAVAACGEAAGDEGPNGDDPEEVSAQAAMDAFTDCMREHGADMPDQDMSAGSGLRVDGSNIDPATLEAAMDACRDLLDEAAQQFQAGRQLDPEEQERIEEAAMAFAQCMRDQGIDFPDPDVSGGRMGMQMGPGSGIEMDDPAVRSAVETCREDSGLEIRSRQR